MFTIAQVGSLKRISDIIEQESLKRGYDERAIAEMVFRINAETPGTFGYSLKEWIEELSSEWMAISQEQAYGLDSSTYVAAGLFQMTDEPQPIDLERPC